ncbi:MAG: DUF5103 domain-containing protein [Bacteroidota bacterium]
MRAEQISKYKYKQYNCFILLIALLLFSCSRHTNISESKSVSTKYTSDSLASENGKDTLTPAIKGISEDNDDYYKKEHFRFEDHIYYDNIKTPMLHKDGWQLSFPIIELNSNEKLKFSFDDMDADIKYYYYTVIHCDADWAPSDILPSEYIEGFIENEITDYKYSFNTIQRYTHYNLIIPNEDIRLTRSGNYILKVFLDNDIDNVALSMRFMIVDTKVTIEATIKRATLIDDRNYKQEIDFTIYHPGYDISNPYGDIKVVITQNGRWDNAVKNLKPLFVRNNELVYDYDEDNVFAGGNEFRYFDIKNFRFKSERVREIIYDSLAHHVYLVRDGRRSFKRYSFHADINGRYFIKTDEGTDSEIEADYAYIHFRLPYDAPMIDGNLYVFGALSQWNFLKETQLKYNYEKFVYETTVYLKQGYYNYEYVFLKDGETAADNTLIEGSHFETGNGYTIYVYHRSFGGQYDQLIVVKNFITSS